MPKEAASAAEWRRWRQDPVRREPEEARLLKPRSGITGAHCDRSGFLKSIRSNALLIPAIPRKTERAKIPRLLKTQSVDFDMSAVKIRQGFA